MDHSSTFDTTPFIPLVLVSRRNEPRLLAHGHLAPDPVDAAASPTGRRGGMMVLVFSEPVGSQKTDNWLPHRTPWLRPTCKKNATQKHLPTYTDSEYWATFGGRRGMTLLPPPTIPNREGGRGAGRVACHTPKAGKSLSSSLRSVCGSPVTYASGSGQIARERGGGEMG